MTPNELKEQFDKFKSDEDRWNWLIENKDEDFIMMLDNDYTYVQFGDDRGCLYSDLANYLGWSSGVYKLLNAIGIKVSSV